MGREWLGSGCGLLRTLERKGVSVPGRQRGPGGVCLALCPRALGSKLQAGDSGGECRPEPFRHLVVTRILSWMTSRLASSEGVSARVGSLGASAVRGLHLDGP